MYFEGGAERSIRLMACQAIVVMVIVVMVELLELQTRLLARSRWLSW